LPQSLKKQKKKRTRQPKGRVLSGFNGLRAAMMESPTLKSLQGQLEKHSADYHQYKRQRDFLRAEQSAVFCLAICRQLGHQQGEATWLSEQAFLEEKKGDIKTNVSLMKTVLALSIESAKIFEELNEPVPLAINYMRAARMSRLLNRHQDAGLYALRAGNHNLQAGQYQYATIAYRFSCQNYNDVPDNEGAHAATIALNKVPA